MPGFPIHNTSGVGTAAYAAPEQLRCGMIDNKSDMYNLEVVLFELFTTPRHRYGESQDYLQPQGEGARVLGCYCSQVPSNCRLTS